MILGRPDITKEMGSKRFREFFYTDEEMKDFCGKNALSTDGSRQELIERIAEFLSGKKAPAERFVIKTAAQIAEEEQKQRAEEAEEDL